MSWPRSDLLALQIRSLEAEIFAAFQGVSRDGGISWSESKVIDERGSTEEQAAARELDRDSHWSELIENDDWDIFDREVGGFSFLDPIGYRYYLPAAMILTLREGADVGILFSLTLHVPHEGERPDGVVMMGDPIMRAFVQQRWSLFTEDQNRCVRRFAEFMIQICRTRAATETARWHALREREAANWQVCLDSYWHKFN